MEIVSISDVHIEEPSGAAHDLFCRFLDHERTRQADAIILLGDIFDLAIGPYPEYVESFPSLFERLDALAKTTPIYYFQGNHDFHLMDIFRRQTLFSHLGNIEICTEGRVFSVGKRKVYVEHGDDAQIGHYSYKAYKALINNPLMALLAKYILNFRIIRFLGVRLSKLSRKRNQYSPSGLGNIKLAFREAAQRVATRERCDTVILGHCHVKDIHKSTGGLTYLNNGYVPTEKCFCSVTEREVALVALDHLLTKI